VKYKTHRPAKPLDLDDEDEDREDDSPPPPRYRESTTKNVIVCLLVLVGTLFLIGGFAMNTTVKSEGPDVYNIGLLNMRLIVIISGFGLLGLASLLRVQLVLEAWVAFDRRRD
jgi:hypothetical protein